MERLCIINFPHPKNPLKILNQKQCIYPSLHRLQFVGPFTYLEVSTGRTNFWQRLGGSGFGKLSVPLSGIRKWIEKWSKQRKISLHISLKGSKTNSLKYCIIFLWEKNCLYKEILKEIFRRMTLSNPWINTDQQLKPAFKDAFRGDQRINMTQTHL